LSEIAEQHDANGCVPDVDILAVHLFAVCSNACARWHKRPYASRGGWYGQLGCCGGWKL